MDVIPKRNARLKLDPEIWLKVAPGFQYSELPPHDLTLAAALMLEAGRVERRRAAVEKLASQRHRYQIPSPNLETPLDNTPHMQAVAAPEKREIKTAADGLEERKKPVGPGFVRFADSHLGRLLHWLHEAGDTPQKADFETVRAIMQTDSLDSARCMMERLHKSGLIARAPAQHKGSYLYRLTDLGRQNAVRLFGEGSNA